MGIVAIAQRKIGNGIAILLLSIVVPLLLGLGLGAARTSAALQEADQAKQASPKATVPGTSSDEIGDTLEPVGPSDEESYIEERIVVYDLVAKYFNSGVPGVQFKLKNNGDRTLNGVDVTIYFKDASGKVIAEEDFHPVLVSEYNFSGDNKPLKPGYIWQLERGKFYSADSVPSEWQEGSVVVEITEIEFADVE